MGLPRTVAGILGFILFVGFFYAILSTSSSPQNDAENTLQNMRDTTTRAFNNTDGIDGVYSGITLALNMVWTTMSLSVQSMLGFVNIISVLPPEFYIIYPVLFIFLIIALIHLIWWGER